MNYKKPKLYQFQGVHLNLKCVDGSQATNISVTDCVTGNVAGGYCDTGTGATADCYTFGNMNTHWCEFGHIAGSSGSCGDGPSITSHFPYCETGTGPSL